MGYCLQNIYNMAIAFYIQTVLMVDLINEHYDMELIYITMLIYGMPIKWKSYYLDFDERWNL